MKIPTITHYKLKEKDFPEDYEKFNKTIDQIYTCLCKNLRHKGAIQSVKSLRKQINKLELSIDILINVVFISVTTSLNLTRIKNRYDYSS